MRLGEWHGRFTAANGTLDVGEGDLVLSTGETGRIVVNRINGATRMSGLFQGDGSRTDCPVAASYTLQPT
jgi:hypothetical protein